MDEDTKKEKRLSSDDRNRAEPCCKHSTRKTTRPIPLLLAKAFSDAPTPRTTFAIV